MTFLNTLSHQHLHESGTNLSLLGRLSWLDSIMCNIFKSGRNETCKATASNVCEAEYAYFIVQSANYSLKIELFLYFHSVAESVHTVKTQKISAS